MIRLFCLAALALMPWAQYEPPAPRVQKCVSVETFVTMERWQNMRIERLERKFNRTGPQAERPRVTIEMQDGWAVLAP